MTRQSTANCPPYSASNALDAIGNALLSIKNDDRLTWADLGAELGKSADQAAKYAEGTAAMDVVTFGRARRAWGSRFSGPFDRLCDGDDSEMADRQSISKVSRVLHAMAYALEDDGVISADEVERERPAYEEAADVILAHLRKTGSVRRVA